MKIKMGPFTTWLGPYQLAEKLCFWTKTKDKYGLDEYPDWVHNFGDIIAHGHIVSDEESDRFLFSSDEDHKTWLYKLLCWIESKKHRKVKIHIDSYDTWGMDNTLAYIIVPMLKQLRDTTHGYPSDFVVDNSDWSPQSSFEGEDFEYPEDKGFESWKETLNKMIWAFEQVLDNDWEDQYRTGKSDYRFEKIDEFDSNGGQYSQMVEGPAHTQITDWDGIRKHNERMQEGFDLFGKYYRNLWD